MRRFPSNQGLQPPVGMRNFSHLIAQLQNQLAAFNRLLEMQRADVRAFNATPSSRGGELMLLRARIFVTQKFMNEVFQRLEPMISLAQAVDCASRGTACSGIEL